LVASDAHFSLGLSSPHFFTRDSLHTQLNEPLSHFACVQLFILCSMVRLLSGELVDYSSPLRSLKCFLARGCLGSNFWHQSPSASLQDSLKCRHLLHHLSPIGTAVILRIKTRTPSMRAKNPCLWVWFSGLSSSTRLGFRMGSSPSGSQSIGRQQTA